MRKYSMVENNKKYSILKIILSITIPIIVFYSTILCFAGLVSKTQIPESVLPLMTIIASAMLAIGMTIGITLNCNIKAMFNSLIGTFIIIALKLFNNLICGEGVRFSFGNIIGIICILVFSMVGSIIGANIKK